MQLILQSIFCCCLLATFAPGVDGAKHDLKRSVRLQRSRRDLSLAALRTLDNSQFVRPDDVKDNLRPHSSTGISIRTKRSKNSINQSRRAGCSLGTCTVHVLAHRLHDLNNKLKIGNAPADKINPFGYGRRRRSVPEKVMTLRQEGSRLRTVWSSSNSQSRLHKLEAQLRRT
ncbi:ADM-like [Sinocyclocheilus rhinocerous]|uniref:Pro-adrenomedullin n=1 Tax=Sinocyclocheilus rhinocerous TaxID=307959 RepID=A0A673JFN7_9TELE|nr:PREDICTED: ADM-like [Sinocyclocheilus rhinocerous]